MMETIYIVMAHRNEIDKWVEVTYRCRNKAILWIVDNNNNKNGTTYSIEKSKFFSE